MCINKNLSIFTLLTVIPMLIGLASFSNEVFAADSYVDNISLTVPVSCSMGGTVNTEHTATLQNGTYSASTGSDYENGIGKTTLTVFCNDNNGFSVYAIGYTGDTDHGDNINKLVGQNTGSTINTKVYSSGDTASNWSMKVNKVTDGIISYLPNNMTIANSYDNWHIVPNTYEQVSTYKAETGSSATDATLGAKLETTYAAYISSTQPADTYQGKVKYVLVNPYNAAEPVGEDQIGVIYDGNGLTFANGATKNRMVYGNVCTPMYIATTPLIAKSNNINDDGTQNGSYATGNTLTPIVATGASQMKVVIHYGLSSNTLLPVIEGEYGGQGAPGYYEMLQGPATGEATYVFNGDAVTFYMMANGAPTTTDGQDYGYYAEVYPIYATEEAGTEETSSVCQIGPISGTYTETTIWKGKWYMEVDDEIIWFEDQSEVKDYLSENSASLFGTTIYLYAYNPYRIVYDGNGATTGTMSGFYTALEANTSDDKADLMAYNFKKTGYGFAGWSEDPNATVNSDSKIYGPNEMITGDELMLNDSTHQTTLYAVWVPTSGSMQNFSCSSLSDGQVTALTDNRDGNVYAVGKMQDGNCWMMENLRLDNTATTLSSNNTNSPITSFTALSSTSDSWCIGYNFPSCTDQSLLNTNNTNVGGSNVSNKELIVSPGAWNGINGMSDPHYSQNNYSQWYGYGNYYNWYSATAGNSLSISAPLAVAAGDICPNGWHLPNGGSGTGVNGGGISGGFSYLYDQLKKVGSVTSNTWRSYPNNFLYSGNFHGSYAKNRGVGAGYWSRTLYDSDTASSHSPFILWLNSTALYTSNSGSKSDGYSVRCLVGS